MQVSFLLAVVPFVKNDVHCYLITKKEVKIKFKKKKDKNVQPTVKQTGELIDGPTGNGQN